MPHVRQFYAALPPSAEMAFAALSLASMAAVAHRLAADVPWQALALCRVLFTLIAAMAMARVMGLRLMVLGPPVMWLRSISGALGLVCTFYAITHMPITDALAIQHTNPLWVAVLLALYYRKRPGALTWVSVALGLAGVLLLEQPKFDSTGLAMFVALLGAWCMATVTMSLRFLGGYPVPVVVAHFAAVSTVVAAATWLLPADAGTEISRIGAQAGWVALIGLLGTVSQLLMTRAIGRGDTQLLALIGLSTIAFAAGYDFFLEGLRLSPERLAGIGLIAASVAVCSRRSREFPLAGSPSPAFQEG